MLNTILELIVILLLSLWSVTLIYYYLFLLVLIIPQRRRDKKEDRHSGKINKFAIIIPAHNERDVISYLIESLLKSDYPKNTYRIFVIADNCTDSTADVAKKAGATVLERFDKEKRGKPYAISWALEQLDKMTYQYDAIVIFDADNLVSTNFLSLANDRINHGYDAFQGTVECKNPRDSWVSIGNYIAYSAINRIFQNGRYRVGLGALLCGTGMGFTRNLLNKIGWDQTSLTEDREFTFKLLLNGTKVAWMDDAVVYDEKPIGARQSVQQQSRWVSGWIMDFRKYLPKIWKKWIRTYDFALLDAMFNLIQPLFFGKGLILLPLLILFGNLSLWIWWSILFFASLLYHGIGLRLNNAKPVYYKYLLIWPFFRIISVWAALKAFTQKEKLFWSHTRHNRKMRIDDVEK